MLQKYVGRTVGVVRTHPTTGAESIERTEVLSAANGVVLRVGDRIETGLPGRLIKESQSVTTWSKKTFLNITFIHSRAPPPLPTIGTSKTLTMYVAPRGANT